MNSLQKVATGNVPFGRFESNPPKEQRTSLKKVTFNLNLSVVFELPPVEEMKPLYVKQLQQHVDRAKTYESKMISTQGIEGIIGEQGSELSRVFTKYLSYLQEESVLALIWNRERKNPTKIAQKVTQGSQPMHGDFVFKIAQYAERRILAEKVLKNDSSSSGEIVSAIGKLIESCEGIRAAWTSLSNGSEPLAPPLL